MIKMYTPIFREEPKNRGKQSRSKYKKFELGITVLYWSYRILIHGSNSHIDYRQ